MDIHDLSRLVGWYAEGLRRAENANEGVLQDFVVNFNSHRAGSSPTQQDKPAAYSVRAARPLVVQKGGRKTFHRSGTRRSPPTRAWALEMIPGVRETVPRSRPGSRGSTRRARCCARRAPGPRQRAPAGGRRLRRVHHGPGDPLPVLDKFNRCQSKVILPTGEARIDDGALSTGLKNYQEFFQTMVGLLGRVGQLRRQRLRTPASSRPAAATRCRRRRRRFPEGLLGSAERPRSARGPARAAKPPYKPDAPCYKQTPPDLNAAKIGAGP